MHCGGEKNMLEYLMLINKEQLEFIIEKILKCYKKGLCKINFSKDEFNDGIRNFIRSVQQKILIANNNNCDFDCVIENITSNTLGTHTRSKGENENKNIDLIKIDKKLIENIYNGNILEGLITIFHELAHTLIISELENGKINSQLVVIVKEKLIQHMSSPFLRGKIDKKYDYEFDESTYYDDNYDVNTEEIICNYMALEVVEQLFQNFLTNEDIENIQNKYKELKKKGNIRERYFESNYNFNSYKMDLFEAFDFLIIKFPNLAICPQLKFEYYLDVEGKVKKYTLEEIQDFRKTETNSEICLYLDELIERKKITQMVQSNNIKI